MSRTEAVTPELLDAAPAGGGAIRAIESAAIDKQIATAHAYPRDLTTFMSRAKTMIGEDPDLAAKCGYETERGGKTLLGPSVRLAEIVASAWGNLRVDVMNEDIGPQDRRLTVYVSVHDLENNVAVRVPRVRSIWGSKGRYTEDMIGVTTQAAVSLAFRDGILRVVPKHFVNDLYDHAMKVAAGNIEDMATTRAECLKAFAAVGVPQEKLLRSLGLEGVEGLGIEHFGPLRAILGRIRRKEVSAEAAFPDTKEEREATAGGRARDVAERMKGKAEPEKTADTKPAAKTAEPTKKPEPEPEPKAEKSPPTKKAEKTEEPAAAGDWGNL